MRSSDSSTVRIESLDMLRGFSILLILFMNIQYFSMPFSAVAGYPGNFGDFNGLNYYSWAIIHVFTNQKGMILFALMFGASTMIISDSLSSRGQGYWNFYKRMILLLVLGLFHAYVIWWGDILLPYAVAGFIVFFLRRLKAIYQIILGSVLYCILPLIMLRTGLMFDTLPADEISQMRSFWELGEQAAAYYVSINTGPWLDQLLFRFEFAKGMQSALIYNVWTLIGIMLIGCGLYKLRVLDASRSMKFYVANAAVCLPLGVVIVVTGIYFNEVNLWKMEFTQFFGIQFHVYGSFLIAWAYVCLIQIFFKVSIGASLKAILTKIGRMSLTQYLLQSIICAFIFYGWGLGLYGSLDRLQLLGMVPLIWLVQVAVSLLWFRNFKQGPIEKVMKTVIEWTPTFSGGREEQKKNVTHDKAATSMKDI